MALSSSINASDVASQFGKYVNNGQSVRDIYQRMTQAFVSASYGRVMKLIDGKYKMSNMNVDSLLQAYQPDFTPRMNSIKFTPREIVATPVKMDFIFQVDEIYQTWLEFLQAGHVNPLDMPLYMFIIQKIIEKLQEDVELEWFNGLTGTIVAEKASDPGKSFQGLKSKLLAEYQLSKINVVKLGTVDKTNIFEKVEDFVAEIPELYINSLDNVFMRQRNRLYYNRELRNANFFNYEKTDNSVFDTNLKVTGLPSMFGSDIIWTTPKENLVTVLKDDINMARFEVVHDIGVIKLRTKFEIGVGYCIPELVWAAIPDAEIPAVEPAQAA